MFSIVKKWPEIGAEGQKRWYDGFVSDQRAMLAQTSATGNIALGLKFREASLPEYPSQCPHCRFISEVGNWGVVAQLEKNEDNVNAPTVVLPAKSLTLLCMNCSTPHEEKEGSNLHWLLEKADVQKYAEVFAGVWRRNSAGGFVLLSIP